MYLVLGACKSPSDEKHRLLPRLVLSASLWAQNIPPLDLKPKVELYSHVPVMRNVLDQLKVCSAVDWGVWPLFQNQEVLVRIAL